MSRLRIAVDVTPIRAGGECGGAKPFVLDLLKGLASASRCHDYRLLTLDHNDAAFASYDAPNVTRWRVDFMEPGAVARMLHDAAFDVLFCPMTAPTYTADGVATVSILYDLQHLAYPSFFTHAEFENRARFYGDLVDRVDQVVCISEFSRRSLVDQLHVAPERTSAVPIAIQDRLPHYPMDEAWRVLGARGLAPCRFGFYPANFWPHKNHRMLLLAFAKFLGDHPDSDLHLVLTGELLGAADDVRCALRKMGLESRVHLLGFVPETDLGALWSAAAFLVFPSLYEGFGIPLTEAMAFGTPILCSSEGSLPEVAGDAAVYFDAKNPQTLVDALAMAVSRPDDLQRMADRARGRLAAFSSEVVVERYLDVFSEVAAQAAARRGRVPRRRPEAALSDLEARLAAADADRTARAEAVDDLHRQLAEAEADRQARLEVIQRLGRQLEEAEQDRHARLQSIEILGRQLEESEGDRRARLRAIEDLKARLAEAEGNRELRTSAMDQLKSWLEASEADRRARLSTIEKLGQRLADLEALRRVRAEAEAAEASETAASNGHLATSPVSNGHAAHGAPPRRDRGVRLMHSGRALFREGRLVRGASVLGAGVVLAPDVVARLILMRKVRPLWLKARGRMFGAWPVAEETQAWRDYTTLHGDGWAGPRLVLEAVVPPGQTTVTISGETNPRHLRGPLELEPFVDGRSLGRQSIGGQPGFAVTWDLGTVAPGQHLLQIEASSFMVPDDYLGNRDHRPISYRLGSITFSGHSQS